LYEKQLSALRECKLFAGHSEQQIRELLPCFQVRIEQYQKGETIAVAGDDQIVFGIVIFGQIQIQKEDYTGNRLIIGLFGPGEVFGEVAVFAGTTSWPNTVLAQVSCEVMFIPYQKLSQPCCQICQSHQLLIANMLRIVAQKALTMNGRIGFLRLRGMREKLAAYLYEQDTLNKSHTFMINMNREQLADYLNVSRPSMSRELGRIRDAGVIDFYRSSFTIKDIAALRKMR
jgi:CRP-like cAMP-binding protein